MSDEKKKPYFSKTQLEMLSRCGMQYKFRYVDGIIAPPGVSLIRGSSVHQTIREDLNAKRETGELLSEDDVRDLARDRAECNWSGQEPKLTEDEAELGEDAVRGKMVDETISLATLHHNAIRGRRKWDYTFWKSG